ncbi:MAG: glutamine-hydrolyzing carbamoyl-phosphate synthase small subunit [Chloroflexi bacterium]|nr:glutamine-hydrolyzing carbamoyl-phosphate synthase small subunit [Chloroflexota bacterium]
MSISSAATAPLITHHSSLITPYDAVLALDDGRLFRGVSFGAPLADHAGGEVVFTTGMTGYQEVCTDPSFRGQIVCLTYPLIGNYGVAPAFDESRQPWLAGLLVRDYCDQPSHWQAAETLGAYLRRHGIPALHSLDTRALTRHLRTHGLRRGRLLPLDAIDPVAAARNAPLPAEQPVVAEVSTPDRRAVANGADQPHLVVIDCGLKENIVRSLRQRGCRVTVVPFDTTDEAILALAPDGVLTSPGPGDPENLDGVVAAVRGILAAGVPYFGICLGHQMLGLAIGARTSRLPFGHRGVNHPVLDRRTGLVHITSQNHGFQVEGATIPADSGWQVSMVHLNDGSCEGLDHPTVPAFSVQYHPEGCPGPQDNQYLFDRFLALVTSHGRHAAVSALSERDPVVATASST